MPNARPPRPAFRAPATRPVTPDDLPALKAVIDGTDLFPSAMLDAMLADYLTGQGGDDLWLTVDDTNDGGPGEPYVACALAYVAPERMTDGTWNLYLIAVHPGRQGRGIGTALLRHVEHALAARGARVLLVETSGLPAFARTRAFYRANGYDEEARVREFYAAGEDKVVFRKALAPERPGAARPPRVPFFGPAVAALLDELLTGATEPDARAEVLNPGDPGLLASLDRLSAAAAATAAPGGGPSVAAHVDHVRYALAQRNAGADRAAEAEDWTASWRRTGASEAEWQALRHALRREVAAWGAVLRAARAENEAEVSAMMGSVAHVAYHLGAIRQVARATRGPSAEAAAPAEAAPGAP
jgi:ribosomal protein S18 acetylase RimI-like enzyme